MRCPHHPRCPGCPSIERPYKAQLEQKRRRLDKALRRYPHLHCPPAPEVLPALRTEGYRHRLKLPVAHLQSGGVAVGLTDSKTGRVLDTPDCGVLHPELETGLQAVKRWMAGRTDVHSVDLRRSDANGELQLILACRGGELPGGKRAARALLRDVPQLSSVAVSTADPTGRRVMGRAPQVLAGKAWLEEQVGDTRYQLTPGAFFQIDPQNAAQLQAIVLQAIGDAPRVLDLYAGVGAYALALAEGRDEVVAVEEVPQAARAAAAMAPENMTVVEGRVEELGRIGRFDAAVLNPARRGSDPGTLARLAKAVDKLVYVSCSPEALARDLDALASFGMRLTELHALDLFPQTPEVETVAVLQRGQPLDSWAVPGGRAAGPWNRRPSGALGTTSTFIALVIGDTRRIGNLPGASYERIATVAGHSLIGVEVNGSAQKAIAELARRGHPLAWDDRKTRRFFADKAGLRRPFLHIRQAGRARAPLHGDLLQALVSLGADEALVQKLAKAPPAPKG